MNLIVAGFWTGVVIPVGIGFYWMSQTSAYYANLPRAPHTANCGMSMLAAWMMILVVGPVGGLVGAFAGLAITEISRHFRRDASP